MRTDVHEPVRGEPGDASVAEASAALDAGAPRPAPVTRTGKVWPFHGWDRAEAVTFNAFPMRPDAQLRAYDEHGWSPHLVERKALDAALGNEAVELVRATRGDVAVSKCAFPRHAVVLYERDVPVASINVCFECGDIVLWPRWEAQPEWESLTQRQARELEARRERQRTLYDKTFPRWKTFFRDAVGFGIDTRYHGAGG